MNEQLTVAALMLAAAHGRKRVALEDATLGLVEAVLAFLAAEEKGGCVCAERSAMRRAAINVCKVSRGAQ